MLPSSCVSRTVTGNEWTQWSSGKVFTWHVRDVGCVPHGSNFSQLKLREKNEFMHLHYNMVYVFNFVGIFCFWYMYCIIN